MVLDYLITASLTDEQRAIVCSPLCPGTTTLVMARAGTGTTFTLPAQTWELLPDGRRMNRYIEVDGAKTEIVRRDSS